MLQVRLLGQFEVRRDDTILVIHSRAAQTLLAFLLLNVGVAHRREKLAGLFWPDLPEDSARHNLRRELWRLRKVLHPEGCLLSDDFAVTFDANSPYWLDTAILQRGGGERATLQDCMDALAVYRGELLPGFYADWVVLERERLRAIFEQKMGQLLAVLERERRWEEVCQWGESWIALGRSPEPAFRALMVAHAEAGDRSQVATLYQRCVEVLQTDLGVEPSEQTRQLFEHLASATATAIPGMPKLPPPVAPPSVEKELPAPGEPPFQGLAYFDENDAHRFFGREQLTTRLVAHLREHSLPVVIGASGSGKSSLVRAGLIPALKRGTESSASPENRTQWQVYLLTPTAHPLHALAVALTREVESVTAAATLADDLERDPRSLAFALNRLISREGAPPLLLVVDQFEELFTLCHDDAEREAFVDNLMTTVPAEGSSKIKVVLALRADFYAHCAQYPALREAVANCQAYIGPMTAEEMRRAIEGPAERGGWVLEPGLVDLILRDVGEEPGALPLLSHALLETWQRRRGRTLTLKGYAGCGGVRGAIAQTAETVFRQLPSDRQQIARNIFLQLTELGEGTPDTRRRVKFEELVPPGGDAAAVRAVLNTLAEARLVTLGEDTAEVAHEALIREWPFLREWLNQDREALRLHRRLTESAQAWEKANRDESELYRGARLAQALEWCKSRAQELGPLECDFIEAGKERQEREEGEREAQRKRELEAARRLAEVRRQRALLLAGALVVAAVLAFAALVFAQRSNQSEQVAVKQQAIAETERQKAESEQRIAFVRELSVNSVNNLTIDPERSILLALQAISVSTAGSQPVMREAEEALHRAVQASRVQLTLRGHTGGVWGIAFSPDGKRLATSSRDKTAKVWDAATGKELLTLRGHDDTVNDLAISPDGTRLATGSWDKTAKIWDAQTGKELLTLRGHTDYVHGIAFSPDGTRVATASLDKTAKLWDAQTGQALLTLVGHTGGVSAIAYSPDGARLATGSYSDEPEHTALVWDATTGQVVLTLRGHTDSIYGIAFSPDGKRLATASADGAAKIWDSGSGQLLMNLFVHGQLWGVAFSSDSTRLAVAVADGTAKVWDAATGELVVTLSGHTGTLLGVAFSPDGTRLATTSTDATAKIWDITPAGSREWLTLAGHDRPVYDVAYSPDGSRLASASLDKTAKIWDAQTGKLLVTLSGHTSYIAGVTFSPDGRRVATESIDETAKIWDVATGRQLLSISTTIFPYSFGLHTTFSPDGQRIATPGAGNSAKVWDAATGQELLTLCCHSNYVRGIAFSPDGTRLVTGSNDATAKVWDATTGKELLTLSGHKSNAWWVTFSPDGKRIATASADATAKLWDAATGKELFTLSGHTGGVDSVAFSPDGLRLATSGTEGTAKVWNVSSASAPSEQPLTLYNPTGGANFGAVFSPDGKRLAAGSSEGIVRVYALPLQDIIAIAKSRVTRSLTQDECQKYLHVEQCPAQ